MTGRDVLLMGAPGSGKGTQAKRLAAHLGVPHVSTGDLFRMHMEQGTALGRTARAYVEAGRLVPDEIAIEMVAERLDRPDARGGSVLDGFPRTLPQAEALDRMLGARGRRVARAVVLEVPEAELLRRLSGRRLCRVCERPYHLVFSPPRVTGRCDVDGGELYQREDDSEEKARRRLADYREKTGPVIAHYRARGVVREVDGVGPIEEVGRRLVAAVEDGASG
ncbi:MAG TPA: adenylate kinase [Thermodesulfobacteriota bacterium]|nr:adenylate kinase [Thermodesulfobacteriota bacterium]